MNVLKHAIVKSGIPEDAIIDEYLAPGSEDATFLMQEVHNHGGRATYLCLGSPTYGGHHHAQFDFDEDLLLWGVNILWEFIQTVTRKNR
jgi:aminobenzoyl-glutamate utilization protein A